MRRPLPASFAAFAAIAILTIMVASVSTSSPAALAQDATFSSAAEEVRIDALVTLDGKPLAGLKASDFEIFDSGVKQEISYIKLQHETPVTALFVFDMSRSVEGELLFLLKNAACRLLADLKPVDQAALISFNNAVALSAPTTHDFVQIKRALDRAKPYGNSALIDGSYVGLTIAKSSEEPSFLIIFSDGRDTFSWLPAEAVIGAARRSSAVVYAVSPGVLPRESFLREVTALTGGTLFEIDSAVRLKDVFVDILKEYRQRYLLTYTPQGVPAGGWHKTEVRVNRTKAEVKARPGYVRGAPGD